MMKKILLGLICLFVIFGSSLCLTSCDNNNNSNGSCNIGSSDHCD